MRLLIAYATTEGQTRKIAAAVADQARGLGHDAELANVAASRSGIDPGGFDAVVIAASVHQDKHQDDIEAFITGSKAALAAKPTLFLSVSLAAAFAESRGKAEKYIADFAADSGWRPSHSLAVAGALRNDQYDYFHQQILEHVVLKEGHGDLLNQDREFTDWQALESAVRAFLAAAPG